MIWFKRILTILSATVVIALLGVALYVYSSLPQVKGTLEVKGLKSATTILRSRHGIPIIKAQTAEDAYFALGFVHAQDRLWQMDLQRRIGAGRLSEILGEKALPTDKFMRTLGLYEKARQDYLTMEIKQAIDSYVNGVNAYLNTHTGAWPVEFQLLGYHPEPWTPTDTLVWGRLMGLNLSSNFRNEIRRLNLSLKLTPKQIKDLYPAYPAKGPVSISGPVDYQQTLHLSQLLDRILPIGGASNAWAVNGEKTNSSAPLLAADPHLAFSLPNMWYLAELQAPAFKLSGATVPGMPYLMIGHNEKIAWAFTTSYIDTADVFIETPNPDNPNQYETPFGFEPFIKHDEMILVKGKPSVVHTVRETRHGPVISDVLEQKNTKQILALKAVFLAKNNTTAEALQRMNWSRSLQEFMKAAQRFTAPSQNIIFAAKSGDIGMLTVGRVPIRTVGDGFMPLYGKDIKVAWPRYIPKNRMPGIWNPKNGVIVNANNKPVGNDYPYFLSHEYQPPYRAQRIQTLLNTPINWSVPDMAVLQNDAYSLMALDLLPVILNNLPNYQSMDDISQRSLKILKEWQGNMDKKAAAPLIFITFLNEIEKALYADELGELFAGRKRMNPLFVKSALSHKKYWCDDQNTPSTETCQAIVSQSFQNAIRSLVNDLGNDPDQWRWGDRHQARFEHVLFSKIPFLKKILMVREPNHGGPQTVNRGQFDLTRKEFPLDQIQGAGLRVVFDLKDFDDSAYITAVGQSGNIFSRNFKDLLPLWLNGRAVKINEDDGNFVELSQGTLTLTPQK